MECTEAILEPEGGIFEIIVDAYRREGFEAGYRRARHDLLAGLVLNCEEFLCNQRDPKTDLRKQLYAFVEQIEHRLDSEVTADGYVEGGLGI